MPPQVPGFNVSVLRQRTFAQANEPLTISGRVTGFGFGLPAFVRVSLDGPAHNPEVRSFDTFASPLSGDYAVAVLAEKEGQYSVYAQAFLPLGVPVPGAPDPIFLGPPFAESPRPPLAIGEPRDGEVLFELEPGRRDRIPLPQLTPVEVSTPITFAPRIEVTTPAPVSAPSPRAPFPFFPTPPAADVPDAPAEVGVAAQVSGRISDFEVE
jgi:hypothetical protein